MSLREQLDLLREMMFGGGGSLYGLEPGNVLSTGSKTKGDGPKPDSRYVKRSPKMSGREPKWRRKP